MSDVRKVRQGHRWGDGRGVKEVLSVFNLCASNLSASKPGSIENEVSASYAIGLTRTVASRLSEDDDSAESVVVDADLTLGYPRDVVVEAKQLEGGVKHGLCIGECKLSHEKKERKNVNT